MMSHHTPQSRRVLTKLGKDPDRLLVVIDPRHSETARIADIHLPIRPGTDALLYRSMISIIINEGWHNQEYIDHYASGFDEIRSFFKEFDARDAIRICELDHDQFREVCRLFATHNSSFRSDLGILLTRHSTLNSYLENVLLAICGRIGVPGGNVFPAGLFGEGAYSDEKNHETWRTVATDFFAICGLFPPNAMPEEILTDNPDRLRAVMVNGANPLRSFADTTAYEEAYNRLDLLVTIDIAMTETALLSHYVLPAGSGYETWEGAMAGSFPEVFFQMRQPVLAPEGERMDSGEIFTRLVERLGIIPDIPDSLYQTATDGDRAKFAAALEAYLRNNPEVADKKPYILPKTLGITLGSGNLALLWGLCRDLSPAALENAERLGLSTGPGFGEWLFQEILKYPEGLWVGKCDTENNIDRLETEDGRIQLNVPEMVNWLGEIDPEVESEKLTQDGAWPLILKAGDHIDTNINTMMRDPAWNKGRRACTLTMHPKDSERLSLVDGQMVKVTTEAGEEIIELKMTQNARPGQVIMPHGFGLIFQGKKHGPNVNQLTKNTHRDRLAGTPLHSYVRCRVSSV